MATIREWLNAEKFNWGKGIIIIQTVDLNDRDMSSEEIIRSEKIKNDNPILDKYFYDGYGLPNCPRFIAEDDKAFYFPYQYDGSTGIVKVFKDISLYLDINNPTPYPGG